MKFPIQGQFRWTCPETRATDHTESRFTLHFDERDCDCFRIWLPSQTGFPNDFDILVATAAPSSADSSSMNWTRPRFAALDPTADLKHIAQARDFLDSPALTDRICTRSGPSSTLPFVTKDADSFTPEHSSDLRPPIETKGSNYSMTGKTKWGNANLENHCPPTRWSSLVRSDRHSGQLLEAGTRSDWRKRRSEIAPKVERSKVGRVNRGWVGSEWPRWDGYWVGFGLLTWRSVFCAWGWNLGWKSSMMSECGGHAGLWKGIRENSWSVRGIGRTTEVNWPSCRGNVATNDELFRSLRWGDSHGRILTGAVSKAMRC